MTAVRGWQRIFSAASFARGMDSLTDAFTVVIASVTRNTGMVALLVADSFAGGFVLNKTLAGEAPPLWVTIVAVCWSLGTSAILMSLWEAALSDGIRGIRPVPFLFAVVTTAVDAVIDVKIITILQYGTPAATDTWLIPINANPIWWLKFILAALLTTFGELGIVFIRSLRRRARKAAAADAAADATAAPALVSA